MEKKNDWTVGNYIALAVLIFTIIAFIIDHYGLIKKDNGSVIINIPTPKIIIHKDFSDSNDLGKRPSEMEFLDNRNFEGVFSGLIDSIILSCLIPIREKHNMIIKIEYSNSIVKMTNGLYYFPGGFVNIGINGRTCNSINGFVLSETLIEGNKKTYIIEEMINEIKSVPNFRTIFIEEINNCIK